MSEQARILVFTGDGKGKTTAAIGMALRASGQGMNVLIIQFVKDSATGEINAISKIPNMKIIQTGLGFLPDADTPEFEKHKTSAQKGLALAAEAIGDDEYDMVVLDEICFAVSKELISENEAIAVISNAAISQCVVLTGRGATKGIIETADTVSEVRCIKHGLQSGIPAQKGVEY